MFYSGGHGAPCFAITTNPYTINIDYKRTILVCWHLFYKHQIKFNIERKTILGCDLDFTPASWDFTVAVQGVGFILKELYIHLFSEKLILP